MNTRSQTSQLFQNLMTLIVIGAILIIGFNLIGNVMNRSSQIEYVKFRSALTNSIDSVASDFNSKQKIVLSVPKEITEVCFIDVGADISSIGPNPTEHGTINAYWSDDYYMTQGDLANGDEALVRNVFLMGKEVISSFHLKNLAIDDVREHHCIDVKRSKIEFWALGKGRNVEIEKVQQI